MSQKTHLHIDIETYSEEDLKSAGIYKYSDHDSFEILIVAFAIGDQPVVCYDWDELPDYFFEMLEDDNVVKFAHNAAFERQCFAAMGYSTPATAWRCTMVKALYCGLPGSLDQLSKILDLESSKLQTGKALINYFCKPCKPTKINGGRVRNLPDHNPEKWAQFKEYCRVDVMAEIELMQRLSFIRMSTQDWADWALDQDINTRGVLIDKQLVDSAVHLTELQNEALMLRAEELTGLSNPNSLSQLKQWMSDRTGKEINDLTKDAVKSLLKAESDPVVREVLQIRQQLGKTSVKKYVAMVAGADKDGRARGLFQFYGANRTGRWAGRRVQLQNLPRNMEKGLETARAVFREGDHALADMLYNDIPDTLSQLTRTAIIPEKGRKIVACDFSAIEARVIAWLAGEDWRLDVFKGHGKIYEASASKMFNIPIETIGKDSPYRQRGKVAELALGYQGGVNALIRMGGDKLGLSEAEMQVIVDKWREANKRIVNLWATFNQYAVLCLANGRAYNHAATNITFSGSPNLMRIVLPSRRELIYWDAKLVKGKFGNKVQYKGTNDAGQWSYIDTYGGKLTENIVQAVSRDLLCHALRQTAAKVPADIILHVHDEIAVEANASMAEDVLRHMESIMSKGPKWAEGLPLAAEGFVGDFYRK